MKDAMPSTVMLTSYKTHAKVDHGSRVLDIMTGLWCRLPYRHDVPNTMHASLHAQYSFTQPVKKRQARGCMQFLVCLQVHLKSTLLSGALRAFRRSVMT